MNEEQIIELDETSDQLVHEAIKQDCGIYKHLYHGTLKYIAHEIQKTAEIKIGSEVGYLGNGFYCYLLDEEASRIWARKKNKTEKIAVLNLVANLDNTFFINQELHRIIKNKATELRKDKLDINTKVGYIIELFIKEIIKPEYGIDIHTVGQVYIFSKKTISRPVLMYSLRDKQMVKKIELYWEEQ